MGLGTVFGIDVVVDALANAKGQRPAGAFGDDFSDHKVTCWVGLGRRWEGRFTVVAKKWAQAALVGAPAREVRTVKRHGTHKGGRFHGGCLTRAVNVRRAEGDRGERRVGCAQHHGLRLPFRRNVAIVGSAATWVRGEMGERGGHGVTRFPASGALRVLTYGPLLGRSSPCSPEMGSPLKTTSMELV